MFTVIKNDHNGRETWRYTGDVIARAADHVLLEARFNRDTHDAGYVVYKRGDRFIEWFYTDRWYNVFRIHDVDDGRLKGWYCNITRPAVISDHSVMADDLALDVFVTPTRDLLLLDEDEFAALELDADEHAHALNAVESIRDLATRRVEAFADTILTQL